MKNILLVFVIVTIILAIFPFATYAEEITPPEETLFVETTAEGVEETTTTEEIIDATEPPTETEDKPLEDVTDSTIYATTEPPTTNDEETVNTFINRITEAWENREISTIINIAFDAALFVLCVILKKSGGKNKVEMVAALQNSKDKTVGAVNELIEAANDVVDAVEGEGGVKGILEDFKTAVDAQIEAIKNLDKQNLEEYGKDLAKSMSAIKLLAEMMQTTYANSTTISMPTKNMITQKYVEICDIMKTEEKANE